MNWTIHSMTFIRPLGMRPLLSQITLDGHGHHDEDEGGHEPEHEHLLRDRKVDPRHRRHVKERVCDVAVGDVLENHLARIKGFLSVLDVFLWLGHAHDGVASRDATAANRRWR